MLEFAEMAIEAGLPPSVLTVLTGTGPELGKTLVSHPQVKKVDVTVSPSCIEQSNFDFLRLVQIRDEPLGVWRGATWRHTVQSLVERCVSMRMRTPAYGSKGTGAGV